MIELAIVCVFVALLSAAGAIYLYTDHSSIGRYNICYAPRNFLNCLVNIMIGKKYLVKVNGTWSVARGKKDKWNKLYILYGQDLHFWTLDEGDWAKIDINWSDEQIQDEIVQRNIRDLITKHPRTSDYPHSEYLKMCRRLRMPQWTHDELLVNDPEF